MQHIECGGEQHQPLSVSLAWVGHRAGGQARRALLAEGLLMVQIERDGELLVAQWIEVAGDHDRLVQIILQPESVLRHTAQKYGPLTSWKSDD